MTKLSRRNIEMIEEELDETLYDSDDAPSYLVVEIVMNILDSAERQGRLNPVERKIACEYVTEEYGFDF